MNMKNSEINTELNIKLSKLILNIHIKVTSFKKVFNILLN